MLRAFRSAVPLGGVLLGLLAVASRAGEPPGRRPMRALADVLLRPPPSVVYGIETPASRMARYYQLGGGVGPSPGASNGPGGGYILPGAGAIPGYSVPILLGAGPDPALSPEQRARVMARYQTWRIRHDLGPWTPPPPPWAPPPVSYLPPR